MQMQTDELDGGITAVRLNGRLDLAGAEAIGLRFTAATASAGRPTVVDCSGLSFIASMGLRLVISSARALGNKGQRLALFGAPPLVQAVFDDAALDQLMPVVGTEAEAVSAVTQV